MQDLGYDFTDKEVSPWGGLRLISETYRRTGIRDFLEQECPDLPQPGSNRGYDPVDLMEGFMVSVLLGASRLAHSGSLRHDIVVQRIFDWRRGMASESTFSRFFGKFDGERNRNVFTSIQSFWFSQLELDRMTIDLDSTILTRYGTQEGVEKGYNPKNRGRGSHHPLLAFVAESKMVANAWMREGNTAASSGFKDFLDELLEIIPGERIGLIRADSGFFGDPVLQKLEEKKLNYVLAAKMTSPLVARIFEVESWFPCGEGYWMTHFDYRANGWQSARRMVVVRKDTDEHKLTGGKLLFPEYEEFARYKYSAFVSNLNLSDQLIWDLYKQRADCENRIRELKYDYGIEGFCMKDFYATEAAFRLAMVAHNIMALFRLHVLNNKKLPQLSTIRFQCIAIGSYLVKSGRKMTLKLSAKDKRRQFLERLFSNVANLSPPFVIS
jgi:hypothetical protein